MTNSLRKKRVLAKQAELSRQVNVGIEEATALLKGARKNPALKNSLTVRVFGNGLVVRVGEKKALKQVATAVFKKTAKPKAGLNSRYVTIVGQMYQADSLDAKHASNTVKKVTSEKERAFYSRVAAKTKDVSTPRNAQMGGVTLLKR